MSYLRAAWERLQLAWTLLVLIAYLLAVVTGTVSAALWYFLRSVWANMGVRRDVE